MFFIEDAFAQGSASGLGGDGFAGLIPIALIFVVFYFLLIRPQQKKLKEHKEMINDLKRGDKIVTAGGIVGIVQKIDPQDDTALVEIAHEVRVKVIRSTISEVLNRASPEKETGNKDNKDQKA